MKSFDPAPANFDGVARIYRCAEYLTLGPLLERTREHFLPLLAGRRTAYVLGDGDGRFMKKFLSGNRKVRVTAVDSSRTMLSLLAKRCQAYRERLATVHASACSVSPPLKTDLIVSHFFLDCLTQEQVTDLVQRVSAVVTPGATWLVSDFAVPPRGLLRVPAAIYIRLLYLAFRVTTGLRVQRLPDVEGPMLRANFRRVARQTFLFEILYTELWEFDGK